MWVAIIVVLVIALSASIYYYLSGMEEQPTVTSTEIGINTPNAGVMVSEEVAAPEPEEVSVTIGNFAFLPASLTVKKGTVVVWTNTDLVVHDVVGTDGKLPELKSPLFGQGGTYRFSFDEVGSFAYYCSVHPSMRGTVTVEE